MNHQDKKRKVGDDEAAREIINVELHGGTHVDLKAMDSWDGFQSLMQTLTGMSDSERSLAYQELWSHLETSIAEKTLKSMQQQVEGKPQLDLFSRFRTSVTTEIGKDLNIKQAVLYTDFRAQLAVEMGGNEDITWTGKSAVEKYDYFKDCLFDAEVVCHAREIIGHKEWMAYAQAEKHVLQDSVVIQKVDNPNITTPRIKMVNEILRRTAAHTSNAAIYSAHPTMETDRKFQTKEVAAGGKKDSEHRKARVDLIGGRPIPIKYASRFVRDWLAKDRKAVMDGLLKHHTVKQLNDAGTLRVLTACVLFFNKAFTFYVCKFINKACREGVLMTLGGTSDTLAFEYLHLDVGSYDEDKLSADNEGLLAENADK